MYYFEEEKGITNKYELTFDKEKLKKLKVKIIDDCSLIISKTQVIVGDHNLYKEPLKYRNVKTKKTGTKEYNDAIDEDIIEISYDEYNFPLLVELIDNLLNDNPKIIKEIKNYQVEKTPIETLYEMIKRLDSKINEIKNLEVDKKVNKLLELKDLLNQLSRNKNQKSTKEYYKQLQELLTFNLIDSISTKEIDRIKKFTLC